MNFLWKQLKLSTRIISLGDSNHFTNVLPRVNLSYKYQCKPNIS